MIAVAQSFKNRRHTYLRQGFSDSQFSFLNSGATYDWGGRPTCVKRQDGVWVLLWKEYQQHTVAGPSGYWNINFSDDEGVTWTANNTKLGGGAVSGFPYIKTHASADRADDGMLFVCANGDLIFISHERLNTTPPDDFVTHWQTRSTDGGETWTSDFDLGDELPDIADKRKFWAMYEHQIINGEDYIVAAQYDTDFTDSKVTLWKSADNCQTYTKVSDIYAYGESPAPNETGFIHLANGHIIAFTRTYPESSKITYKRESLDYGATWGSIQDYSDYFGRNGVHQPRMYKFPASNRIYLAGRNYQSSTAWKNWFLWSDDNGISWTPVYLDNDFLSNADCGYVQLIQKENKDIYVISYTGTQDAATVCSYYAQRSPF